MPRVVEGADTVSDTDEVIAVVPEIIETDSDIQMKNNNMPRKNGNEAYDEKHKQKQCDQKKTIQSKASHSGRKNEQTKVIAVPEKQKKKSYNNEFSNPEWWN